MTDNTTPTETVDTILEKHAEQNCCDHGIKNSVKAKGDAKSALHKAFENAMEAVLGEEGSEDQRQRAKEQIKLMFGE